MNNRCRHATVVVFVAMLPISTIGRALAHDHQHPELNGWYESLRSGKGPCCDGTDAQCHIIETLHARADAQPSGEPRGTRATRHV